MKGLIVYIAGDAGKISSLDGIRAFAIILVLGRHGIVSYNESFEKNFDNNFVSNILLNGWLGVDLFFVLSGFLIGFHLLSSWPTGKDRRVTFFGQYWLKRILRTFPVYYFVILLIVFDFIPFYQHNSRDIQTELFIHLTFLQDYYGTNLLVPMWSLATEEKFYLICPLLLWGLLMLKNNRLALGLSLLLLIFLPFSFRISSIMDNSPSGYAEFFWTTRAPFHLALDGLLMGVSIAFLNSFKTSASTGKKNSNIVLVILMLTTMILLAMSNWLSGVNGWLIPTIMIFIFSLLFALIVYFSINCTGLVKKFLSSVLLRFISKISYCLYLVHMLMLPLTVYLCQVFLATEAHALTLMLVYFVLYLILSVIISVIIHLFIEKPFLYLKGKVSY